MKYSIMIPARNGREYLSACISSVLSQNYSDYELLVSNNYSADDTAEYLSTLNHPNLKILQPPHKMSMTEHFEWVLAQAQGDWLIFVGLDDGLQAYFFELADILTERAEHKKLKIIGSARAYYFYSGCEAAYGDSHISYKAGTKLKVMNTKMEGIATLFQGQPYFTLPQMYASSIWHKSLIEQVRSKQNGKVFCTECGVDANLAAIACSLTKYYLYSDIPLGWVGSSPRSNGLAMTTTIATAEIRTDYIKGIQSSKLNYCSRVGNVEIGSCVLYFFGALLDTKHLQNIFFRKFIDSKFFAYIVISSAKKELQRAGRYDAKSFSAVEEANRLNKTILKLVSAIVELVIRIDDSFNYRIKARLNKLFNSKQHEKKIDIKYSQKEYKTMGAISAELLSRVKEQKILESIKLK